MPDEHDHSIEDDDHINSIIHNRPTFITKFGRSRDETSDEQSNALIEAKDEIKIDEEVERVLKEYEGDAWIFDSSDKDIFAYLTHIEIQKPKVSFWKKYTRS